MNKRSCVAIISTIMLSIVCSIAQVSAGERGVVYCNELEKLGAKGINKLLKDAADLSQSIDSPDRERLRALTTVRTASGDEVFQTALIENRVHVRFHAKCEKVKHLAARFVSDYYTNICIVGRQELSVYKDFLQEAQSDVVAKLHDVSPEVTLVFNHPLYLSKEEKDVELLRKTMDLVQAYHDSYYSGQQDLADIFEQKYNALSGLYTEREFGKEQRKECYNQVHQHLRLFQAIDDTRSFLSQQVKGKIAGAHDEF